MHVVAEVVGGQVRAALVVVDLRVAVQPVLLVVPVSHQITGRVLTYRSMALGLMPLKRDWQTSERWLHRFVQGQVG
jgi:hypothetical protein